MDILFMISIVKKLLEHFMKKNYRRLIKKNLDRKVIKRKGDKLYVKWKGYDSSFNSRIDKKDLVWFSWFQFHCAFLKTLVALQSIKWVNIFQNLVNHLVEILTLKLIFQVMQQRQILKSPNIGTLPNGVLIPKLLDSLFASWFLTNLDFFAITYCTFW